MAKSRFLNPPPASLDKEASERVAQEIAASQPGAYVVTKRSGKQVVRTEPAEEQFQRELGERVERVRQANIPSSTQTSTGGEATSFTPQQTPPVSPSALAMTQSMYGKYSPRSSFESAAELAYGTYGSPKLPQTDVEKIIYVQRVTSRIEKGEMPSQEELSRTYRYEKELEAKRDVMTATERSDQPRVLVAGEAANIPRGARRFTIGFGEGYRSAGETLRLPASATGYAAQVGAVARGVQFFTPVIGAGAAPVLTGSKAGVRAAQLLSTARATKAGAVGTDLLIGTGLAVGGGQVARTRYELLNLDTFERQALKNIDFKTSMRAGEQAFLRENQFVGSRIVSGLPGSQYFISQTPSYRAGVRQSLIEQGVPSYQIPTATRGLLTRTQARASGEAVEALLISRGSEVLGRRLVSFGFPAGTTLGARPGWQVFRTTAPRIATAGAYEGLAMYGSQAFARGEAFDPVQAAVYTGVGGTFAGLFGGAIAGTAVSRRGVSRALLGSAYITDPFEYPGDVLASVSSNIREPVISKVVTGVPIFTPGVTKAPVQAAPRAPSSVFNFGVSPFAPTNIFTPTPVTTVTPTPSAVSSVFSFAATPFTPVQSPIGAPVQTPTPTPVQTPTPTPTTTPVPINIGVPIVQPNPQLPILPFIPSFDVGGLGMAGLSKRRGTTFVNEVQASQRALKRFLGNFEGVL